MRKRLGAFTDRPSPAGGLPGRRDHAHQPMKPSIKRCSVQGRGALRHELTACLRTGRVLRMPRARTRGRGKTFISPEIMISQRPGEAADRGSRAGPLGRRPYPGSSAVPAIGTLVERTTRFTLLLYLPRMAGHGHEARVKNGPALAGHGAEAVYVTPSRARSSPCPSSRARPPDLGSRS